MSTENTENTEDTEDADALTTLFTEPDDFCRTDDKVDFVTFTRSADWRFEEKRG